MKIDRYTETSYDLTMFKSTEHFEAVRTLAGLDQYTRLFVPDDRSIAPRPATDSEDFDKGRQKFVFHTEDLYMVTACHPVTGQFKDGTERDERYASTIAVAGTEEKVERLTDLIDMATSHVKGKGGGYAGVSVGEMQAVDETV